MTTQNAIELTSEEVRKIKEGWQQYLRGEYISLDELKEHMYQSVSQPQREPVYA